MSSQQSTFQSLPVKTLVKILAHLRGGEIGFDPYRDDRTSKKDKLLSFILSNHDNSAIVDATTAVLTEIKAHEEAQAAAATATPRQYTHECLDSGNHVAACGLVKSDNTANRQHLTEVLPFYMSYADANRNACVLGFTTEEEAAAFMTKHPSHHYTGKFYADKKAAAATTPKADFFAEKLASQATTPQATQTDETAQIANMLASLARKGSVDEAKVREICDARAQDYVDNILGAVNTRLADYDSKISALQFPTTVSFIKSPDLKPIDLGLQHKNFATLLKMSQARMRDGMRLNIWLKGPAGSGKTTAASKVADALELAFHFNGAISTEYELMGFKDASGAYHRTAFREAFEHGGVYLFDEIDSSMPKAVLAFNAALANGKCRFPDAQIARHKDCVIIAGANTAGNGANSDYVGRMKQDMAFLNRFVMLDWPLDEAFEKALSGNKDWCRKVQRMRKNAETRKIKGHIISPRATFYGEALLAVGLDEELVEAAVLKGALAPEQWEQLCQ